MPDINQESSPPEMPRESTGEQRVQGQDQASTGINSELRADHEMPTAGRQAFKGLRRELTDADLANPGVQKMLLAEIERVDSECANLTGYQERFHEADKEREVLKEKLKAVSSIDVIFGAGTAIGGALIGLTLSLPGSIRIYSFIFGVLIISGVTIARLINK